MDNTLALSPMIERLRSVLAVKSSGEIRECRRCGTTLDRSSTRCPVCQSEDIARYQV